VAARIVETAARLTADLVVIGTHGLGGVDHLMLGSVAEKVLRKSLCPVLVVPPGAHLGVRVKRILCPVDFSSSSTAALRLACSIAKEADARISILHVLEWSAADSESLLEDLEVYTLWEERVRRRLEALLTDEDRTWCEPVPTLDSGKPYRKILEVARRENTDLIVMGVAGRGALDLLFFGSTTNHVVRQAPCPVLTLRTTSRGENGGYERMPETRRMASPTS
jgi:nucleotide-binding universal stress UspA family protein